MNQPGDSLCSNPRPRSVDLPAGNAGPAVTMKAGRASHVACPWHIELLPGSCALCPLEPICTLRRS